MGRRRRRHNDNSKSKLYLVIFIAFIVAIIWLGTKEISNESETVTVDVTEQIKAK